MPEEIFNEYGQQAPFSLEAEQSVLGGILIDPSSITRVADTVKAEYFYLPQHQAIYTVMSAMFQLSAKIDTVTVLEELKKSGVYDDAGGKAYLVQLAQTVPSVANIESYAAIVREKYYMRSLISAARKIISDTTEGTADAGTLLDSAEQRIFEIRQDKEISGLRHIKDIIVNETLDRIDKISNPETRADYIGIPCGISDLDRIITGLNKSDLIILGARPGMGKTSFALNVARNVAVQQGKSVCFFSLEMTRDQLAQRLLSDEASIQSNKMRTGEISPAEWTRLVQASDVLSRAPIYFDESSGITAPEIKAKVRRMKKADLIIIDYLQLMRSARRTENRVQEVSDITGSLKTMAKDLGVPVLVCAQLSRGTEQKGKSHRPQLADLRESGSIEQDADIVLFLYRENYYKDDMDKDSDQPDESSAEVIVAKNRHGETGSVKLHWAGEFTRFTAQETNRND